MEVDKLGALYTKAVTPLPRAGNGMPRIVETPSGLLNAIGLANVGLERFVNEKLPVLSRFACAVIVNVAGSTESDYLQVLEVLGEKSEIAAFEINLSCPNVKEGCLAFGSNPSMIEHITKRLRSLTSKPLIIKLTPNVTDISSMAAAAENGGADAISCINTLVGMVIDVNKKKPVLANGTGGLSGPAIRPVGVAAVYKVSRAVKIPVIGMGGICNTEDALQYLLAGASAIQVGTATFVDPQAPMQILSGIQKYMEDNKIGKVEDIKNLLT
jgi:dihydroorotate dehydrogenase (NAD+) catalytic subunit